VLNKIIPIFFVSIWIAFAIAAEPIKIIIFPFNNATGSKTLAWLSEGISESISKQICVGTVRSINRNERIELVENFDLPPVAQLSHASMIQVAQSLKAHYVVFGGYEGTNKNLKITVRILTVSNLKLSGEIVANGPLVALPQMENELAWLLLSNSGLGTDSSRDIFQQRMRIITNPAYAYYIESLTAFNETDKLDLLLKAVGASRDFPEAQLQIGSIYFRKQECAISMKHLLVGENINTIAPIDSGFMLGTCHAHAGKYIEAITYLSQVLHSTRRFDVLNNLGVTYLQKGDDSLASDALSEAAVLSGKDSTVSLNLAIMKHIQGNDSGALAVIEGAVKTHPQNGMLHFLLGFLLRRQNQQEKADAAINKAKELGINVETFLQKNPRTWSRLLINLENEEE
jgi:Flp pilus assembly protein TadD/TolB-like protein